MIRSQQSFSMKKNSLILLLSSGFLLSIFLLVFLLSGYLNLSKEITDPNCFELRIVGPKRILQGQGPTSLTVEVENQSSDTFTFLPYADGNWHHWRYPHYSLRIRNEQGQSLSFKQVVRCGVINPIDENQIVTLAPGQSYQWQAGFPFRPIEKPGRYELIFSYDSITPGIKGFRPAGFGKRRVPPLVVHKLKKTIRTELVTDPFVIEILPVTKAMLKKRITLSFTERPFAKPEDFAFLSRTLQQHQWYIDDIRQENRHISCLLKFAKGYNPPQRPEHIPSEYWFNQGRYLLVPQSRNPAQGSETYTPRELMSKLKVYFPHEANNLVKKHEFLKHLFYDPNL